MNITELVAKSLQFNGDILLNKALEGLSDEDLHQQPGEESNSIGWLLWHMTRTEDNIISRFSGKPSVWDEEGWQQRIPFPEGASDNGLGHTPEQVGAFRARKQDLLGYAQAVRKNTLAVLPAIPASTIEAPAKDSPAPNIQKEGDFLSVLLIDYMHHAGQICYLRGLLRGHGWLGF